MAVQKLVRLTLEHPQYPIDYSFPSHEEVCYADQLFSSLFLLFSSVLKGLFQIIVLAGSLCNDKLQRGKDFQNPMQFVSLRMLLALSHFFSDLTKHWRERNLCEVLICREERSLCFLYSVYGTSND